MNIPSYADGMQVRDFIYVKDAVKVIIFFLNNSKFSGVYNVGTGNAETFKASSRSSFIKYTQDNLMKLNTLEMPNDLKGKYQYYTQARMR